MVETDEVNASNCVFAGKDTSLQGCLTLESTGFIAVTKKYLAAEIIVHMWLFLSTCLLPLALTVLDWVIFRSLFAVLSCSQRNNGFLAEADLRFDQLGFSLAGLSWCQGLTGSLKLQNALFKTRAKLVSLVGSIRKFCVNYHSIHLPRYVLVNLDFCTFCLVKEMLTCTMNSSTFSA